MKQQQQQQQHGIVFQNLGYFSHPNADSGEALDMTWNWQTNWQSRPRLKKLFTTLPIEEHKSRELHYGLWIYVHL